MKIAFIINGKTRRLNKLIRNIDTVFEDVEIKIYVSTFSGHFDQLCQLALDKNHNHLIFVGGDGSVNEGINGLINYYKTSNDEEPDRFDWQAIAKIKVGVFPAGSGNDFVKTVYHSTKLKVLKDLIVQQSFQPIDVGWASFQNQDNQKTYRFFMNIADVGMASDVVRKTAKLPGWLGSSVSYYWAILSTLIVYKNLSIKAFNANFIWEGKIINFVVANGKYFGNGLGIAPDAEVSDGNFSLVIIGDINLITYFKLIGKVKKCIKVKHPNVKYLSANEITIVPSSTQEVNFEMDGEYVGNAPVILKCMPGKINFIR